MTDLEITKACAEAMEYTIGGVTEESKLWISFPHNVSFFEDGVDGHIAVSNIYDPLHDDAQAMALVKKFHHYIGGWTSTGLCACRIENTLVTADDLNRAICECVYKLHTAKRVP